METNRTRSRRVRRSHRRGTILAVALAALGSVVAAYTAGDDGVTSLLGRPLRPIELSADVRAQREAQLAEARRAVEAAPDDEDAIIWLGRRTAYHGRYGEAIEIFSRGLERHPDSARLRRHRGHRYLTVRRLDDAIADLERAARLVAGAPDAVEADGMPNAAGIPRSTTQGNIHYHLGLARYLRGEFGAALRSYRRCMDLATNDDTRCASAYWRYLTLRRLGREAEARASLAPFTAEMDVIENDAYHRLLLMYKGELAPDELLAGATSGNAPGGEPAAIGDATTAYGVGMAFLLAGDRAGARVVLDRILAGSAWPAFGYLAAEAERARM